MQRNRRRHPKAAAQQDRSPVQDPIFGAVRPGLSEHQRDPRRQDDAYDQGAQSWAGRSRREITSHTLFPTNLPILAANRRIVRPDVAVTRSSCAVTLTAPRVRPVLLSESRILTVATMRSKPNSASRNQAYP